MKGLFIYLSNVDIMHILGIIQIIIFLIKNIYIFT